MDAVFVELPAFERHRSACLDDDDFVQLQDLLMSTPEAGISSREPAVSGSCVSPMRGEAKENVAACE